MGAPATGWCLVVLGALSAAGTAGGLSCWQCGEYSDGVGSITPCLNTSSTHLRHCAPPADRHCIKYVSELSTVRDCASAAACSERESWGARSYCCQADGCNPAPAPAPAAAPALLAAALAAARARH